MRQDVLAVARNPDHCAIRDRSPSIFGFKISVRFWLPAPAAWFAAADRSRLADASVTTGMSVGGRVGLLWANDSGGATKAKTKKTATIAATNASRALRM